MNYGPIIHNKSFQFGTVADATEYRFRYLPSDAPKPVSLAEVPFASVEQLIPLPATMTVSLSQLMETPPDEGRYDIYLTAVDEAGNESAPAVIGGYFLDQTPPATPQNFSIAE